MPIIVGKRAELRKILRSIVLPYATVLEGLLFKDDNVRFLRVNIVNSWLGDVGIEYFPDGNTIFSPR